MEFRELVKEIMKCAGEWMEGTGGYDTQQSNPVLKTCLLLVGPSSEVLGLNTDWKQTRKLGKSEVMRGSSSREGTSRAEAMRRMKREVGEELNWREGRATQKEGERDQWH